MLERFLQPDRTQTFNDSTFFAVCRSISIYIDMLWHDICDGVLLPEYIEWNRTYYLTK